MNFVFHLGPDYSSYLSMFPHFLAAIPPTTSILFVVQLWVRGTLDAVLQVAYIVVVRYPLISLRLCQGALKVYQ